MCISVVFPAPFSPSSAWISPLASWKSTWSLAVTPGKRLVIPRISNARVICLPQEVRNLACHPGLDRPCLQTSGNLLQFRLHHLRNSVLRSMEGRQTDAVVARVEHLSATLERALDGHLDRSVDGVVDPFHGARKQLVGAFGLALLERRHVLVLIHSEHPYASLRCPENGPRAGSATTTENHVSSLINLRQRRRFPTGGIRKTVNIHTQELASRADVLNPGLIALAEADDRGDFCTGDHTDRLGLRHQASQCSR